MLEENILKAIKDELNKGNNEFFSYAWREKLNELGEFLEEESKYSKLVSWIENKINFLNSTKNVFSPADKDSNTTLSMVNTYLNLMQNLVVLIHCKELLLDKRSNTKMRENIEYTICKLFKIRYSEHLGDYV